MSMSSARALFVVLGFMGTVGCASKPAAPFDTMPQSNVTALRLQNYEPPAAAAATPGVAGIPGLPPEIQQWAQTAVQSLPQLIPGLNLNGLIPGAPPAPAGGGAGSLRFPQTTPNFRVLGQTGVMDQDVKEDLAKLLGNDSSYEAATATCLYAEMGLTWQSQPGAPSNDLLISFSCNQVQMRGGMWPFASTGMKASTVKELTALVKKIFPPGT
jgi:hypothetical protein